MGLGLGKVGVEIPLICSVLVCSRNTRLISVWYPFPSGAFAPEPCHHVGIQPQRDLLLHWPIQGTASGTGPIQNLGYVARIDFLVGKGRKRLNLRLLLIGKSFRSPPSSYALLSCAVAFRAVLVRPVLVFSPTVQFGPIRCRQSLANVADHTDGMLRYHDSSTCSATNATKHSLSPIPTRGTRARPWSMRLRASVGRLRRGKSGCAQGNLGARP